MSCALLVYVYTGLTVICVLLEEQLGICALPEEQTVIFECSPPQLHAITKLVALPGQVHTSIASVLATQVHAPVDKIKAVHAQLSLPPPIVNETG